MELVTLREFTEADAEALFSWASDPRVVRFQRRDAYSHVDEARRYIRDHILPHPWYRAICVSGAARPVGSISVKPGPTEEGRLFRASVGYRVAHDHWGRGIATRAVRMAAEAVFAGWPWLLRLEAVADAENPASQRVLEKAGFAREGLLRSVIFWTRRRLQQWILEAMLPWMMCLNIVCWKSIAEDVAVNFQGRPPPEEDDVAD